MIEYNWYNLQVPEDAPDGEAKNQDVKLIVQTVSRYMHLSLAMVMRDICYQFRHLMQKRRLTFVDMGRYRKCS